MLYVKIMETQKDSNALQIKKPVHNDCALYHTHSSLDISNDRFFLFNVKESGDELD